jgi:hypothetical protein
LRENRSSADIRRRRSSAAACASKRQLEHSEWVSSAAKIHRCQILSLRDGVFDIQRRYSSDLSSFAAMLSSSGVSVAQHSLGLSDRSLACSGDVQASLATLAAPISHESWDLIVQCGAAPYSLVILDSCSQRLSRQRSECAPERAFSLINACAIGLRCTSEGGCLVIRLSDALSRFTAGMLMLLTSLFSETFVMRPQCCKPHSAESFV